MCVELLEELVPAREYASIEIKPRLPDGSYEVECTDCGQRQIVNADRPFVHWTGCRNARGVVAA